MKILQRIVEQVFKANPNVVADAKEAREAVHYLVWLVCKEAQRTVDRDLVTQLIYNKLSVQKDATCP